MKKNNIVVLFSIICILVLFLTYIQFFKKKQPDNIQKVTLLLDWYPNTNHTGIYVALAQNYFAREGLEVDIIQPSDGDSLPIVASGKADFGISSQESVTLARAKNIPIVSIAAIIQHNTSVFASKKEANISNISDFEGKRYAGWGSPIEETTLKALMTDADADYKKIAQKTIGTSDFFSTIGRESDIQWIFYGWDGIEAKRRGIDLNYIWLKDLNPALDYYTPVIVTTERNITQKPKIVKKFMKAVHDGYEYAINNPNNAASILIHSAPELNDQLVQNSQLWLSKEYKAEAQQWGVQKKEVWSRYSKWLFKNNLIEKDIDVDKAFTNKFLPLSK